MPEYELVQQEAGAAGNRYRIKPEGIVIGRAPEADVVIPRQMVSRQHARVWIEGDKLRVKDLDSRNGVGVNGQRVKEGPLSPGDKLIIGDCVFSVAQAYESASSSSSVISFEDADNLADELAQKEGGRALPILYKAAQLLGTVFDLDDLLERILKIIFEALPVVRRGFIVTMEDRDADPEIHASLSRGAGVDVDDGPPLSHTLIRHVFEKRSAMLTLDAMDDSRFDASQSIMHYGIHAAMCAPLIGRQSIVGAIYVDAGAEEAMFNEDDLELMTAIARIVGVAVENAHLYQENMKRERLVAIGQATAGVGHCVKNILTGIKGGAQFVDMALENRDFTFIEKGWPIMHRAIERIEMLVLNMLTFSRDRSPDLAPADVNAICEEVICTVKPRAEKEQVALEFDRGSLGVVFADGRELYRVVMNLVVNGIDACGRQAGTVTVSTRVDDKGCYIAVRDTGCGIPPEIMPKLSQAFVSTKGSSGTGLGLACSYKIVNEHGGRIDVESEPGQGAAFTVFLPARPDLEEALKRKPATIDPDA